MLCRLLPENIEVVMRLDAVHGLVRADQGQIEQVRTSTW